MNDFTKEELQYLWDSVDNNITDYFEPDIAYELRDKLQSMLDNYYSLDSIRDRTDLHGGVNR